MYHERHWLATVAYSSHAFAGTSFIRAISGTNATCEGRPGFFYESSKATVVGL
jgi:hypothetical protein